MLKSEDRIALELMICALEKMADKYDPKRKWQNNVSICLDSARKALQNCINKYGGKPK